MKLRQILTYLIIFGFLIQSSMVFPLNKTSKTVIASLCSGVLVGVASYYYDDAQKINPEKKTLTFDQIHQRLVDGIKVVEEAPKKKYTHKQCLRRAALRAVCAAGITGFAAHILLPGDFLGQEVGKSKQGGTVYTVNLAGVSQEDARIEKQPRDDAAKKRIDAFCSSLAVPYTSNNLVVYTETKSKRLESHLVQATEFRVAALDTLDCAATLIRQGYKPLVLDMANEFSPGGGPHKGCTAQEEQICYRSNLFTPLYYARSLVPTEKHYHEKPFISATGAIYVPNVTVTKASEAKDYKVLSKPFKVDILVSAACDLRQGLNALNLSEDGYTHLMKEKIRTQLRVAREQGHDTLLLSAFGCGAFKNKPDVVAKFYKDIFDLLKSHPRVRK